MKQISLFFLLLTLASAGMSQPSFTSADLPGIGDEDTVMYLNYYPLTNNLDTETGNGYSWDFTALPFSTYPNFKMLDTWRVKTHTVSASFPAATIEEFVQDGTAGDVNLFHFGNDTLYIDRLGSVVSGASFIPAFPSVAFPVSFDGSSVITAYFHSGIVATGQRTTTFHYDGYGTLHMPGNKSYSNVLRVKKIEKDSNYITNTSITYINYIWYKQGGQVPLLRLAYTGSLNLYFAFGSKAAGSSNGIAGTPEKAGFSLSPNPSGGHFTMTGVTGAPDEVDVTDAGGKPVVHDSGEGWIDLSQAGPGLYFVTVRSGSRVQTCKAVVR